MLTRSKPQMDMRPYEDVNRQLMKTGWFRSLGAWEWVWPLQMQGYLATGERFSFSYRADRARLTISDHADQTYIRDYRRHIPEFANGPLPPAHCLALVKEWIGAYRSGS